MIYLTITLVALWGLTTFFYVKEKDHSLESFRRYNEEIAELTRRLEKALLENKKLTNRNKTARKIASKAKKRAAKVEAKR